MTTYVIYYDEKEIAKVSAKDYDNLRHRLKAHIEIVRSPLREEID